MVLSPGTKAPDFTLKKSPDQTLSLAELRGQPVVLVFYPADWSPVCGDELALFNEVLPEFARYGAQVVGISVDGIWCHKAYAKARNLDFPLLADFEPKGEVCRKYDAYRTQDGFAERRSEEHTSELQSPCNLVCRLLLEKKKNWQAVLE